MAPCPFILRGCKYTPPFGDSHHKWWPAPWYTTPLEKRFRNHPDNIEKDKCRCLHDLEHCKQPPRKPSVKEMRAFLEER